MPEITVIMPVLDRNDEYKKSLHSLLNQNFQGFEAIVCFNEQVPEDIVKDSKITYLKVDAVNVNEMLKEALQVAKGEIITFLEPSEVLLFDALSTRKARFDEEDHLKAVYGFGFDAQDDFQPIKNDCFDMFYNSYQMPDNNIQSLLSLEFFPFLSSIMVKKSVFDVVKINDFYSVNYALDFLVRLFKHFEKGVYRINDPIYISNKLLLKSKTVKKTDIIRFLKESFCILENNLSYNKSHCNSCFQVFFAALSLQKYFFPNEITLKLYIYLFFLRKNSEMNGLLSFFIPFFKILFGNSMLENKDLLRVYKNKS